MIQHRRLAAIGLCSALSGLLTSALAFAQPPWTVSLRVFVPEADAKLTIDGAAIKGTGTFRKLQVAPKKGANYILLSVEWEPNGYTKIIRTRKALIKPGQTMLVDLRDADRKFPDKIEVIYVPTPQAAVEAMCKMANVGPGDIVYDLGCGDGRIVITAVKKFQAKQGVGVDINANLVKQCKVNAKKEGIERKVEFRTGDVLNISDLSSATVVMLYMGEDINLRLRPILQKTLKPGARIVSHSFGMGDWQPNKSQIVRTKDDDCKLFLWLVDKNTKDLAHAKYDDYKRAMAGLERHGTEVEIIADKIILRDGRLDETSLRHLQVFPQLRAVQFERVLFGEKSLLQLAGLKKIARLHFLNTSLKTADVKDLKEASHAEVLHFPFAAVNDACLAQLSGMAKLKELDLTATPVTNAGMSAVAKMTALKSLILDGTKVNDAGLAKIKGLPNLRTLGLSLTGVTDAGLEHLHTFPKLKRLNLRGTNTSVDAVGKLRKNLPKTLIMHAPKLLLGVPK